MKVFISWSGEPSKTIAEELTKWLPKVIQAVEPFMSDAIPKGGRWFEAVREQIEAAQFGISVVTPFNLREPWLLFEAGAIGMRIDRAQITPLIIGLRKADLEPPLSMYQATDPEKKDMFRLVTDINNQLGERRLSNDVLEGAFNAFWGELETKIASAIQDIAQGTHGRAPAHRDPQEVLEEILTIVRGIAAESRPRTPSLADIYQLSGASALKTAGRSGLSTLGLLAASLDPGSGAKGLLHGESGSDES